MSYALRILLTAGLAALIPACGDGEPPAPSRPHVVFISIDTLRADHLNAYGYHRETAPHLARLADEGVVFDRCIAVANWTLPTHATLFTGMHPAVHGVEEAGDALAPERQTLGEVFAAAGYATTGWFTNPFVSHVFGFGRGFDVYAPPTDHETLGSLVERKGTPKGAISRSHQPEPGPREKDYFVEQTSGFVIDRALEFLDERTDERPFLMFLHFNDVHGDYIPPAPYDRRFDPDYQGTLVAENVPHNKRIHARMPPDDLAQVKALYDGEIAWVDEHLGQLFDALDARGLSDDTLIVVTADHGEGFFEHGAKGHHYGLNEELVHIPFVVRWPQGVPGGRRIEQAVSQADIAPTLVGLAGLQGLPDADGRSWAGVLTGRDDAPRPRPLYSRAILNPIKDEAGDVVLSLRTDAFTVIRRETPEGQVTLQVFDHRADPEELAPLAADDPATDQAARLLDQVARMMEARGDTLGGAASTDLPEDPELLEQMRQWGYIQGPEQR